MPDKIGGPDAVVKFLAIVSDKDLLQCQLLEDTFFDLKEAVACAIWL